MKVMIKLKRKLNSSEIIMKLNFTFDYNENNTIYENIIIWGEQWGEQDDQIYYSETYKAKFKIAALSQFPSGNFITNDDNVIVIYDKSFKVLQTISPFVDEFGKYTRDTIRNEIDKILIKDENNFIILTNYGSLKFYKKEENIFIFKNEIRDKKPIYDIIFDNSKTKIFSLSQGFIKIFKEDNNGNFLKSEEIKVSEIKSLEHFEEYCEFNLLLLEDKNILIVKGQNSIWFFNVSENYRLLNFYEENERFSEFPSIDRYDEDKIISIYNGECLKVISMTENKVLKMVKAIYKLDYNNFRRIKVIREKNIIILGGKYDHIYSIIQILRLDNLETIQTIKLPKYESFPRIYLLKNDLVATTFDSGLKLWYI